MNLWIRSQDKMKLFKCENIMISKGTFAYEYRETPLCKEYEKKDCWYVWGNDTIIGKYSVEKRALEVLDEILEAKLGNFHYKCPSNVKVSNNENTIVYEMPKD